MSKCKPKTRFIPALCAWSLLIGATALFFVFPCRYLTTSYQIAIPIWQGIITIFVVANFTLATFMDPGIIPKASKEEIKDDDFRVPLYKNVEINGIAVRMKWCTTCRFYRPPRCSHCSVCNICIETFDHHCPWVNNCIGRRNYRHFFMFLVSLSIHMTTIFAFCVLFLLDHTDQLEKPDTIVCIAIMVIIFCLIFPILGLTGFHVVLVSRGRTTNEQVTGKFRGGYNPFSRGCCKNIGYTLCGPLYPRYTGRRKSRTQAICANSAPISTIPLENQVRVYMDASNGVRISNLTAYNKMSQGAGNVSDTDLAVDAGDTDQSQSRDCEPTPPCPRSGSKTNLFDTAEFREAIASGNHASRGRDDSATSPPGRPQPFRGPAAPYPGGARPVRARIPADGVRSRSETPDRLSPDTAPGVAGSPRGSQGSIHSPGSSRTPSALTSPVRRSGPGTPTTPGSPGGSHGRRGRPTGCNARSPPGYPYYQELRQRQQQLASAYPHAMSHLPADGPRSISPQRKFASESELTRPSEPAGALYIRGSNNRTSDNLYESGGPARPASHAARRGERSPERGSNVYAQTPVVHGYRAAGYGQSCAPEDYRSHPASPTSSGSRPPLFSHGRRSSGSTSPQPKRKVYAHPSAQWGIQDGGAPAVPRLPARRPMSFVKALEVSDSMETMTTPKTDHRSAFQPATPGSDVVDRKSFYDTNYEISV